MTVTIETVEEYEKLIAKVVTNNTARLSQEQEPLSLSLQQQPKEEYRAYT